MPPKKKLVVRNPGKPIMISKAKAEPKKKVFKVRNPGKPIVVKKAPKTFDYYYTGAGNLNQFINDIIDLKSEKTNRKVGFKSVRARFKKLIKTNPNPTNKEVKEFYDKEYPMADYYEAE